MRAVLIIHWLDESGRRRRARPNPSWSGLHGRWRGESNDEPGLSPELVGAVITPTLDAVSTQEMALREGRVEATQNGEGLCQGPSLSFSQLCTTIRFKGLFTYPD